MESCVECGRDVSRCVDWLEYSDVQRRAREAFMRDDPDERRPRHSYEREIIFSEATEDQYESLMDESDFEHDRGVYDPAADG